MKTAVLAALLTCSAAYSQGLNYGNGVGDVKIGNTKNLTNATYTLVVVIEWKNPKDVPAPGSAIPSTPPFIPTVASQTIYTINGTSDGTKISFTGFSGSTTVLPEPKGLLLHKAHYYINVHINGKLVETLENTKL